MEFSISSFFIFILSFIPKSYLKSFNDPHERKYVKRKFSGSETFSKTLEKGKKIGFSVQDVKEINQKPQWLDENKLKLGQQYALENITSISLIGVLSLNLIFVWDYALDALIYTNNSSTTITAFKRYLSTVMRVKSWYESDLLDHDSTGYKNFKTVFKSHYVISKKMNSLGQTEKEQTRLDKRIGENQIKSTICPFLIEDTAALKKEKIIPTENELHFNQTHMAITQFGFVALLVLYPQKFGITDTAGIENFVHLWRYIGHMLGIEDEYNLCSGSIEQVRNKMEYVLEQMIKPRLSLVDPAWEHMSRMVVEGLSLGLPTMSFEASIAYVFNAIGVKTPTLKKHLSWYQYSKLLLGQILFGFLLKFKPTRYLINTVINRMTLEADKNISKF